MKGTYPFWSSGILTGNQTKVRGHHIARHIGEFGLDVGSEKDRMAYTQLAFDVIDRTSADMVGYDTFSGQGDSLCAFYFDEDNLVIVNTDTRRIVSLMKYEEGRNAKITAIRNSLPG